MLKMEINKGEHIEIEALGTIIDITAELLVGIEALKDKFDANGSGEVFAELLRKGLEMALGDEDEEDDEEDALEERINKLVDKALEDDDALELIMDMLPDELKADFAKRMKERASEKK